MDSCACRRQECRAGDTGCSVGSIGDSALGKSIGAAIATLVSGVCLAIGMVRIAIVSVLTGSCGARSTILAVTGAAALSCFAGVIIATAVIEPIATAATPLITTAT